MNQSEGKWASRENIMVFSMALAILFIRMPGRLIHGFLWAEDGNVFLTQAYSLGFRSIWQPYAGYLHLLPRLIALGISNIAPIGAAPRAFAWICAVITATSCGWLFAFFRRRFQAPIALAFALAPILVPQTGEVLLTITNLQWVLAPTLLTLLWDEALERSTPSYRVLPIVALTLTGPFGLLFLPIVVVEWLLSRSSKSWRTLGAYVMAVLIQFAFMRQESAESHGSLLHFPWRQEALHHLVFDFLIGSTLQTTHWLRISVAGAALMVACVVLCRRIVPAALMALALGLWALGVVRTNMLLPGIEWSGAGSRYFYLPFVFMVWALLITGALGNRFVKLASIALLAMTAVVSLNRFKADSYPVPTFARDTDGISVTVAPGESWTAKIVDRR
jgi:hypothetical protein